MLESTKESIFFLLFCAFCSHIILIVFFGVCKTENLINSVQGVESHEHHSGVAIQVEMAFSAIGIVYCSD